MILAFHLQLQKTLLIPHALQLAEMLAISLPLTGAFPILLELSFPLQPSVLQKLTVSLPLSLSLRFPGLLPLPEIPFRAGPWPSLAHIELGQSFVDAKGTRRSGSTPLQLRLGLHLVRIVQQVGIRLDLYAHIVVHLGLRIHTADVYANLAAASLRLQLGVGTTGEGGG